VNKPWQLCSASISVHPMARQWRIEYPGAIYLVLSRGNNRQDILLSDDDRYRFLDCLTELHDRFDIELYAYVLMSNHYHLLLKTNQPFDNAKRVLRLEFSEILKSTIIFALIGSFFISIFFAAFLLW
jgi:Transposase IS200 like